MFVRLYSDPAGSCGSRVHRAMIFSHVGENKGAISKHHFHCMISVQLNNNNKNHLGCFFFHLSININKTMMSIFDFFLLG